LRAPRCVDPDNAVRKTDRRDARDRHAKSCRDHQKGGHEPCCQSRLHFQKVCHTLMTNYHSWVGQITKRVILAAAVVVLGIVVFRALRSPFVKAYFRLERSWGDRPERQGAAQTLMQLEPALNRLGILGPARMRVDGVSFLLDPRDLVPLTILRTGEWQPEVWNSAAPVLSEGSVFFDVGAHIGYFSMKGAARVGKTGRVVAFEPNPETLRLLRDNVAANHFENVIVEPIACTDREQTLTLYAAPEVNTGASSLSQDNASVSSVEAARPFTVRGRPIDDVVQELGLTRVDAMKIDVEGAEVIVLRGAVKTLNRFHPKLVIEVVPRQLASFHTTVDDLTSLIRGAGYNLSKALTSEQTDWEWTAAEPQSTIRMADASSSIQLVRGFNALEQNTWRWTMGKFTVVLRAPVGADRSGASLMLNFVLPDGSLQKLKSVTVSAQVDGARIAPEIFSTPGPHVYRGEVPASAFKKNLVTVDFSLDKFLPASEGDHRELGLVVTSVGLQSK